MLITFSKPLKKIFKSNSFLKNPVFQELRIIIKKIAAIFSLGIGALAFALAIGYFTPRKWGNLSHKDCEIEIYVADRGMHSDIIVPLRNPIWNWQGYLSLAEIDRDAKENYNYLSFGWGDRRVSSSNLVYIVTEKSTINRFFAEIEPNITAL